VVSAAGARLRLVNVLGGSDLTKPPVKLFTVLEFSVAITPPSWSPRTLRRVGPRADLDGPAKSQGVDNSGGSRAVPPPPHWLPFVAACLAVTAAAHGAL
jgi:hypothetical protein